MHTALPKLEGGSQGNCARGGVSLFLYWHLAGEYCIYLVRATMDKYKGK
jgi:hypothetical protein